MPEIKFRLIRSNRRTVGLEINHQGDLIVRAPERLELPAIKNIVKSHRKWIIGKLAEFEKCRQLTRLRRFTEGEKFLWLGREYPLLFTKEAGPALRFTGESFILSSRRQGQAREIFKKWYRKKARVYFEERIRSLAARNGFRFKKFRLSSARTRWGSCSARGTISLNWRLILAPPEIIDYVIIHELAHTREKNHSRTFWDLVARQMPDFRQRRLWLKQNGFRLNII
ncbi:MAG: M48 family metallopeptidase [Candidatus Saccharicenans sp.]|uniref:M48 family metallopeptidase n=1 Tax=Candidatus Saccharicenans sp. TaxID=2819258 RepID=UPI00404B733D